MTRLKDALEKAAARPVADVDASRGAHFSHPPQVVPDVWEFETAAAPEPEVAGLDPAVAVSEGETLFAAEQPAAAVAAVADVAAVAPAAATAVDDLDLRLMAATPEEQERPAPKRLKDEFWHTYRFGPKGIGKVVVGAHADSALVEQYRRLGAALHHHQLQSGARTMMVTSAVAAEGKTLTATNLALTLSHSYQRRVLLIDADLRRPSIHDILRLPNTIGLSDYLKNPEKNKARFHVISPNLSALTAGRGDSDPMAGLVSDTMNRLLAEAAQQFDWVIVDTPPVALLPDANLLAAMIDTALLVVSANATPYPLVRRALEAIGEQRILGVVLNRMARADMVASYSYYGYGSYHYGFSRKRGRGLMFWKRQPAEPKVDAKAKVETAAG